MKILQVNKFHYPRGGADRYYLDLSESLSKAGHELAFFAMHHPKNLKTKWSKYFVSRVSFNEDIWKYAWKIPGRLLYSLEAKRKFSALLKDFQPDVIHCHNIYHQLSPSILHAAKKAKIPVIMHLHDYSLVCPNHSLFTHGEVCQQCQPGKYWPCVKRKCVKNSRTASFLAATELYLHQKLLNIYQKNIELFISPSEFLKKTLISNKWPENKVRVISNPFRCNLRAVEVTEMKKYFLYFGRLSQEKGIDLAIKALKLNSELTLKIVGQGPEKASLQLLADNLKVSERIEFIDWQEGNELSRLIIQAQAVLIPSRWLENFPLNALESLSLGTPIIAANIGGLPEIVNNKNGLLIQPEDSQALAEAMDTVNNGKISWNKEEIKISAEAFSPDKNLQDVLTVYQEVIEKQLHRA
ncbi:glycosyltransferase [Patescibacteria group bacterium]|nr:glycosyltransferase [Patescibacteria group bacterium]